MTYTWIRPFVSAFAYNSGAILLASIPAGQTYVRQRFRWGVYADSRPDVAMVLLAQNTISAGLVTTVGDGTETVPNARSGSGDAAPPLKRWIYWETRGMIPTAVDAAAGVVTWRDTGSTEMTQSEGQVAANFVPGGLFLNLWFSYAADRDWFPDGNSLVWGGFSILVKS